MNYRQTIGQFGENMAVDFLKRHGYTILARNLKISYKEVDIIAQFGRFLVFLEVKTKFCQGEGWAEEAFDERKFKNLQWALEEYLEKCHWDENYVRIDLIAINFDKNKKTAKIRHYTDVY